MPVRLRIRELLDRNLDRAVSRARGELRVTGPKQWLDEHERLVQGPMADAIRAELAKCLDFVVGDDDQPVPLAGYSTDWSDGGPIIERQRIAIKPGPKGQWLARREGATSRAWTPGPTPLVAAMRCYVIGVLGETIEL